MTKTHDNLEAFTRGYAHAMLWANTQSVSDTDTVDTDPTDVDPMAWHTGDPDWALDAFDADSQVSIHEDCEAFFASSLRDLISYSRTYSPVGGFDVWECAGHDFALTRNSHGAGFWDRGMGELGDRLSDMARPFGESTAWTTDSDEYAHLF